VYYYLSWIVLIVVSLWVSLVAFLWALRTGQFSDQTRARYLPLSDESLPAVRKRRPGRTVEVYALALLLGMGLLAMTGAVLLTLAH
jgi:cbb3-type cytochrome oxidase maturation protein